MRTSGVRLSGLGVYLPPAETVEDAVRRGLYPAVEAELHQLGGAAVAGDVPAFEMALSAAKEAFGRSGRSPSEVDLLLYATTWHQGPEGWLPHSYLQRHLTGGDLLATEIRQGCNGIFSALELASSYLLADPARGGALVVAADNYGTPRMDRWRLGPGYIAGDAATALVLTTGEEGFARLLSVYSATVPEAEALHRGDTPLFPPSITTGGTVSFAQRGEQHRRAAISDGTAAMAKLQDLFPSVVRHALDEASIGLADVTRVAFMTTSREIVEQRCMVPLGLPMSKSTWDFGRTVGHCGASDQLLALNHLLTTGQLEPGDHVLMLASGPGVVVSCAVVQITGIPSWATPKRGTTA
ncbi:ketoacyl-ACP synthase III family protein [Amycolatopsis suaedae]|uniref:3-oxoacyl-ACP synthase n=1 Tax=Amycolatopsis suaedae TaxID=2510978 RepID=A0A4Q7J4U6_9PSEU|nr:ketoacyl-ACP synthase III family protein [Amycolatopsis suaedae]RZQ61323.1 3-oxoacyl-ACP synthase [Amycolatopsis suaedae]